MKITAFVLAVLSFFLVAVMALRDIRNDIILSDFISAMESKEIPLNSFNSLSQPLQKKFLQAGGRIAEKCEK